MSRPSGLGVHLGNKSRAHVQLFVTRGRASWANIPKCEALRTDGQPCKNPAIRHGHCCHYHMPLREFVLVVDPKRRDDLLRIVETSTWAAARQKAQKQLRAMERRAARFRQTYVDPRIEGGEPEMLPADYQRCCDWLARVGYSLDDASPLSGEPVTGLCRRRCLWAAAKYLIKRNIDEAHAMKKILAAHRSDRRFYRQLQKAEADV